MGLRAEWATRAEARRAPPRQPQRAERSDGRFSRLSYPPPQPSRGVPIVNAEALMTIPWVWRCVHNSADVAAGFPLMAADGGSDPLPDLMRWDPIGQTGYTARHLLRDLYMELQIHGMGFLRPVDFDDMDRPTAVVPLSSEYAYPVRYGDGRLRVQLATYSASRSYSPDEVMWFQRGGGLGNDGAYSPVRFLARQAGEDILQAEHAHRALVSGGVTQGGGYWATDQSLTPDLAGEWSDYIEEAGGGRSARSLVVGDGLEFKTMGMSWAELQLLEARRYSAVETCAVWGMPPGLLGISIDGASTTYSNLNMDLSLWDRMTLEPLSRDVSETLSVWYEPMTAKGTDLTRPSPLERAKQHEIELRAGYRDRNEVREDEGLEPRPEFDEPATAASMAAANGSAGGDGQRVMIEEIVEELARNGSG